MTENEAVIKIISKKTSEYNKLLSEHNVLLKIHVKTVNDYADKCMAFDKLKSDNKDLRAIVVRFERDNERLQESLDGAQREIVKLVGVIENLYDCGDDLRNFVEGEGG